MQTTNTPISRLNEWLKEAKLPKLAKLCIDNFVISCEHADEDDMFNFIYIDIMDFSPQIQDKLIEGFSYAYFGIKPAVYPPKNVPEFYRAGLN